MNVLHGSLFVGHFENHNIKYFFIDIFEDISSRGVNFLSKNGTVFQERHFGEAFFGCSRGAVS